MSDDELAKQLPNLISKLNSNGNDNNKGSGSSSSGNSSQKSGQGSPKTQESSNIQGEKDKKLISEVRDANSDTTFRLKLGGFTSGRSSRKGSSCSTPVGSSLRTEMDYPSPNFIRPNLSQCPGVSVDENSKLTIRLHYNPVMDEWLSLTEEVVNPRARDDSDVIFDLLKEEGLFLGGSSGINVAGAIQLAKEIGPGNTIVTILCDSGQRYQSRYLWMVCAQYWI